MGSGSDTVVISRVFDAPRGDVFRMWTDPAKMALWWGPEGTTTDVAELDARKGGRLKISSIYPDGKVYPMFGVMDEFAEPELIAFTSESPIPGGDPVAPGEVPLVPGTPNWRAVNRVTFEEVGDQKTKVTVYVRVVHATVPTKEEMESGFKGGWTESLGRLAASLEKR